MKTKKLLISALVSGSSNGKVLFLVNAQAFDIQQINASFQASFGAKYNVNSLNFRTKKTQTKNLSEHYISSKDFSFLGKVSTEKLQQLINEEYEYVFHFFSAKHTYLSFISANIKANLRIGFEDANPKLVDLFLNTDKDNLDLFFKEAKKYLSIINNQHK